MTDIQRVINTAKNHLDAKRARGETFTPGDVDASAVIAWQDPAVQYRFGSFGAFEACFKAKHSEGLISEYKKREKCTYQEALLAVSERHLELVR